MSTVFAATGLLVLAACAGSTDSPLAVPGAPTTSVPVGTETPGSSGPASPDTGASVTNPAETVPPVTVPPVTDPPAPVAVAPTAATTVVYIGSDFGGGWSALATWDGTAWQPADFDADGNALTPPPSDFAAVSVASLGLDAPLTELAYDGDDFFCVDERMGPVLDLPVAIGEISASNGYNAVAVATDWDIQPRPVEQIGLDVEEYQAIGESIAVAAGVDGSRGDVVQVVRVDLDANGVEEVLVTFERITDGPETLGDFSLVFARYPTAAGDVVDEVLFEYYAQQAINSEGDPIPAARGSVGILAVADFNGDAVMEVAVRSQFYESVGVGLYSLTDGTLELVANSGCGV